MIGRIQGIVWEKKPPQLLINVGGIGYEIHAPMSTFYHLPQVGCEVVLQTHLIVREDAHILYGFLQERERSLFRSLIKISNIGPKSALTILSGIEPETFVRCVIENDMVTLAQLPGIGKKTAERLVVEMRDRLGNWQNENMENNLAPLKSSTGNQIIEDAISALVALGYKPQDARRVILRIDSADMSSEELIRFALQNMMKGNNYVSA